MILSIYLEVEMLGHIVCFNWRELQLYFIEAVLYYIPISNINVFGFSTFSPTFVTFFITKILYHTSGCEVLSCCFDLHFYNN